MNLIHTTVATCPMQGRMSQCSSKEECFHLRKSTQSDFVRTPALERYQRYGGNVLEEAPVQALQRSLDRLNSQLAEFGIKKDPPVCQSCGDIFVLERYDNKLCATCGHEMVEDQQQRYAAE